MQIGDGSMDESSARQLQIDSVYGYMGNEIITQVYVLTRLLYQTKPRIFSLGLYMFKISQSLSWGWVRFLN